MDIVNPALEEYMLNLIGERGDLIREMESYGSSRDFPYIGPLVGSYLQQIAKITGARRIFEMGSGFGYSAIWFSRGAPSDARIICTDGDSENRDKAVEYFRREGIGDRVEFRVGIAQEILKEYDGPFDIIFNDIDKEQYPDVIELVISRLREGGLFITDNSLWDGEVINSKAVDIYTEGVKRFNSLIAQRDDLLTTIIPLRDGLSVSLKV